MDRTLKPSAQQGRSVTFKLLLLTGLLSLSLNNCDCNVPPGGHPGGHGLLGRWQVTEDRGQTQLALLEFRPDGSCMGFNKNSQGSLLTYTVDPTQNPAWLDLRGPSNFWNPCIFRFRGPDELEIGCAGPTPRAGSVFGQPPLPPVRPTVFETSTQPLVLRRIRP